MHDRRMTDGRDRAAIMAIMAIMAVMAIMAEASIRRQSW